jgi:two-component system nitrate/nitrite response regulator NarL
MAQTEAPPATSTPEKAPKPTKVPKSSKEHPIRICIADDHTIFRDGLRRLLGLEEDMEVVGEAKDGSEVADVIRDTDPDVLLLDLKMPGLDGLTLLQRMQNQKMKTRIIVLTASDDEGEYVQAMKYGTCGIVLKQTATDLLIKSIRKVYQGEIWLDSRTTAAVMRQFASPMDSGPRDRDKPRLSNREREIVGFVSQGFKNKEIAERMFISEQTVKNHLHNIFDKLGVSDRLELALYAIHRNIRPV